MMIELQSPEDGGGDGGGCGHVDILSTEELECKICYCAYNLGSRRPKLLECCHRLCAKCLAKILDLGESPPNAVVCPFCRYITRLPGEAVSSLPDDCNLVAALALKSRNQRNLHFHQDATTELLLSPRRLTSLMGSNAPVMSPSPSSSTSSATTYSSIRGSPNFVVITIMEPPPAPASNQDLYHQPRGPHTSNRGYHSSSLDSMASITQRWTVWNCAALLCQTSARALVWVLGLLYFSSLPMGVYLLIMQRTTLGVLLVSLVPASLVMIMVYGFCQCICHEFWDCMPP
ncbi:E3 ubiquitin-protein ligase RNF182 [Seriola lalandi dorsalis]|uniref:E3 ubiquitin-protein ligase RNF182 n=1 Tax=Seriola lalandi dorsalis TaxID=1841481 RepID=UPI000C6F805B|nr:E3 ubiquitin-protein ligase RNF182 [Seriola lalandi dorsalis]XP_056248063.1 E3 ubiquitin-protein ligase RNF182 [Seriola aureovittata]